LKIISAKNLFELFVLVTCVSTLTLAGCGGGGGGNNVPLTAIGSTKMAVGNTWTWSIGISTVTNWNGNGMAATNAESETQTIVSMVSGIATVSDTFSQNSSVLLAGTLTRQIDPLTGDLNETNAASGLIYPLLPQQTVLRGSFESGTSWTLSGAVSGVQPYATATVTAINVRRTVPAGTFNDCIQVNVVWYRSGTATMSEVYYFSPSAGVSIESHFFASDTATNTSSVYDLLLQPGYIAN
jgi:hypothetical protein